MRFMIVAVASFAASTALAQVNPNPSGGEYGGSQEPGAQPGMGKPSASKADQDFVTKAAQANLTEIQIGQLAVQKGTTPDVRKMGQMMMDDHRKVNDQLRTIAQRQGINMPTDLSADQRQVYDRLQGLSGAEFDRAYMDQLKTDHQQAISLYQNESQSGIDPQLKSFAQSTLPALRQHEHMVSRPMRRM